jgi:uncharacterized protein (TIGR04255 family)
MGKTRLYLKSPITEAIIDFRVQPPDGISLHDLARCHNGQEESYPSRTEVREGTGFFELGPRVSASASARHVGFIYPSADQKQVYQVRLDGFSFSRLAPYESWESFCKEARRLWWIYRRCVEPVAVNRLSVRYVNRLDVPGARVEIKDYLRTMPEIAPDLPQALDGYFMQLQVPMDDIGCKMLLNETISPSPLAGCLSIILDIDLFRTDDIPSDEERIWEIFEILRVRKNEVFEACVTDRARELFE